MKLILALFLSVVACVSAAPADCTESELSQCSVYDPRAEDDAFKETEEYLNTMCKSMGCMRDFKRRCGVADLINYLQAMLKQAEKTYSVMCDKDSQPMRKKYLDNAKCINRMSKNLADECRIREPLEIGDADYCKKIAKSVECAENVMERECGKDAREVHTAVAPGLEFHGCTE